MKRGTLLPILFKSFFTCSFLLLAGCAQVPLSQSGSNWHENDFVTLNLAAQLSNPADMTRGHGDMAVPAQSFVAAITSWSTGKSNSSGATASPLLGGTAGGAGAP